MTIKFYLGTHQTHWLRLTTIPLMVSHRRLSDVRELPSAICSWLLDSGGFSELQMFGKWETSAPDYAMAARRYQCEIGGLEGAAIQDWMCEPFMLKKTGLTVQEHQTRTVNSYRELKTIAPDVPWFPVLQGYKPDDYKRHVDQYMKADVNLHELPRVGVGSICRRQHSEEIANLLNELSRQGLRLHGFGVKLKGLALAKNYLVSADSMSWSFTARREQPLKGHEVIHKNCANCRTYAELWYRLKVWPLIQNGNGHHVSTSEQTTSTSPEGLDKMVNLVQGRGGIRGGLGVASRAERYLPTTVFKGTNTARSSEQIERGKRMNFKLVLKTYAQLRQLTDDESALLNTLRGMTDTEREMTVEAFGGSMGKVVSKSARVKTTRNIEHCGVCDYTRRAAHHKEGHKDYHEFVSGKKSARASSLASAIKGTASGNHKPLLCDYEIDGKVCHGEHDDRIHDKSLGYGNYHPFQSAALSAGSSSSIGENEVSSAVETESVSAVTGD